MRGTRISTAIALGFIVVHVAPAPGVAEDAAFVAIDTPRADWCEIPESEPACKDALFGGCVAPECRKAIDAARGADAGAAQIEAAEEACKTTDTCAPTRTAFIEAVNEREKFLRNAAGQCDPLPDPELLERDPAPGACTGKVVDLQNQLHRQRCRWLTLASRCRVRPPPPPLEARCGLSREAVERVKSRTRSLCAFTETIENGEGVRIVFSSCRKDDATGGEAECLDGELMRQLEAPRNGAPPLCEPLQTLEYSAQTLGSRPLALESAPQPDEQQHDSCLFSVELGQRVCTPATNRPRFAARTAFERAGADQPDRMVAFFPIEEQEELVLGVHLDRQRSDGEFSITTHRRRELFSPDAVCSPDDTTRAKGHAYQLRRMLLAADPGAAFLDSPILHGVVTQDCATLSDGSLLCWSYANSASRPGPAIADSERQPVLRTWRPGASADEMPQRPKLFANSAMQAFVGRFFVLASHGSLTLTWWPEATQDGVFAVLGYRDELFEASGFDLDWLAELVGIELGTARPRFNWWLSRVPITAASPVRPDRYTCWREGPGANRRLHCGDFGETVPSWRPLARLDEDARKVLLGVVGRGDAANLFERLADTGQDARVLAVDGGQLDDMALLVEKQTGEMAWISPYRPETPALWISPSVPGIAEEDEPRVPFDAVADTQEKRIALRLQADAHRAGAERIYLRIAAGTPDSGRRNHIVHAEMPGCHRLRRTDPGYPLETQWHDLGTLRVRQVQSIPEALRRTAVQGESEPQRFLRCLTADPAEQAHTCDVFNPRALLQPGHGHSLTLDCTGPEKDE